MQQRLRPAVRTRRSAFDQVAGERERCSREPDQRDVELLAQQSHRLEHLRNVLLGDERSQACQVVVAPDRLVHHGTSSSLDPDGNANRRERHHDVAEQDRGVDRHPSERLERDLDDLVGVPARLEDVAVAAERPILRQVPSGLAHEPHGRAIDGFPSARAQEPIGALRRHRPRVRKTRQAAGLVGTTIRGRSGIRTHGRVAPPTVFKTVAFVRSAILPTRV